MAALVAHEKFNMYAYEHMVIMMKLAIVFLLTFAPFDKLIFYAFLILLVSTSSAVIYSGIAENILSNAGFLGFRQKRV